MAIILGIDPALANTGWAVLEIKNSRQISYITSGVIRTKSDQLIENRLAFIAQEIENIINLYRPVYSAIEETFVNKNAVTSLKLGYARGAIISVIGKYKIEMMEIKPNLVKKSISISGHADKQQILFFVKTLFPELKNNSFSFDEADAIAIAYTCFVLSR